MSLTIFPSLPEAVFNLPYNNQLIVSGGTSP